MVKRPRAHVNMTNRIRSVRQAQTKKLKQADVANKLSNIVGFPVSRSNPIRHVYMGSWSFDHPVRFQGCHSSADRVLASKFMGVSKPTHRIGILALTLAIFISSKVLA